MDHGPLCTIGNCLEVRKAPMVGCASTDTHHCQSCIFSEAAFPSLIRWPWSLTFWPVDNSVPWKPVVRNGLDDLRNEDAEPDRTMNIPVIERRCSSLSVAFLCPHRPRGAVVQTVTLDFTDGLCSWTPPVNNPLITCHDEVWHANINKGLWWSNPIKA